MMERIKQAQRGTEVYVCNKKGPNNQYQQACNILELQTKIFLWYLQDTEVHTIEIGRHTLFVCT